MLKNGLILLFVLKTIGRRDGSVFAPSAGGAKHRAGRLARESPERPSVSEKHKGVLIIFTSAF